MSVAGVRVDEGSGASALLGGRTISKGLVEIRLGDDERNSGSLCLIRKSNNEDGGDIDLDGRRPRRDRPNPDAPTFEFIPENLLVYRFAASCVQVQIGKFSV